MELGRNYLIVGVRLSHLQRDFQASQCFERTFVT